MLFRFKQLVPALMVFLAPVVPANEEDLKLAATAIKEGDLATIGKLLAKGIDPNSRLDLQEKDTLLIHAIEANQPLVVEALLKGGADPALGNDAYFPPLFLCADAEGQELARILIKHGVSPDSRNNEGDTSLIQAAHHMKEADVRAKLALGMDPDLTDPKGNTALMAVADAANLEAVKALVEAGAKLDLQNQKGETALLLAAAMNAYGERSEIAIHIIEALVKAGANPNIVDESGQSPLVVAISSYDLNNKAVEALLAARPDLKPRDRDGYDALLHAAGDEKRHPLIPKLLELGAEPKTVNHGGSDALMLAARTRNARLVADFIKLGLSAKNRDRDGQTAAHYATGPEFFRGDPFGAGGKESAGARRAEVLGILRENGADLDAADRQGVTPLQLAAGKGDAGVVKYLLSQAPDPDRADEEGITALHHAAAEGSAEVLEALLTPGRDTELRDKHGSTPLWLAALWNNRDAVTRLLEAGANIDAANNEGETALQHAVKGNKFSLAGFLVSQGAAPEKIKEPAGSLLQTVRLFHETPVDAGDFAFGIELLSKLSKEIDRRDAAGMTALMWVAASNNEAALKAILARHPDLEARSPDGRTALMWASASRASTSIKLLRDAGADDSPRDHSGRSAKDWLEFSNRAEAPRRIDVPAGHEPLAEIILRSRREVLDEYMKQGSWKPEDRLLDMAPLHLAASLGDTVAIGTLLERDAPVDQVLDDLATPLMTAALNGQGAAIEFLLLRGANASLKNRGGQRAIDLTATFGHLPALRLLLATGDVLSDNEASLLLSVVSLRDEALLRDCLKAGMKIDVRAQAGEDDFSASQLPQPVDPLIAAARSKDSRMLAVLADYPEACGLSDADFLLVALHQAADGGSLDNVRFLVEKQKADPDKLLDQDFGGTIRIAPGAKGVEPYSALSRALEGGHQEIVRYLLDHGVTVRGRTRGGMPPLSFAVIHRQPEMLRLLLGHTGSTEQIDFDGQTALHHAAELGDEAAVRLLLEKGAKIDAKSTAGKTPLDLARDAKAGKMVKILEAAAK